MYEIRTDPAHWLVIIGFQAEFWDAGVADRFRTETLAAVASLGCAPGTHSVLVDLRNAVLQSQDVFARLQAMVSAATAARIALVAASPLARMQTKRLQIRDNVVLFAELKDARLWLLQAADRSAA